MALFRRESGRRRTRHFDLDAATRGPEQSRFVRAFSRERIPDTLPWIFFFAIEVALVTAFVPGMDWAKLAGAAALVAGMNLALGAVVAEHHARLIERRRHLVIVQLATVGALALARLFVDAGWPILLFPLGVFGIALSIAEGQRFGMHWSLYVATAVGLLGGLASGAPAAFFSFPTAATLAAGSLSGIAVLGSRVTRRQKMIRAGLAAGVAFAAAMLATEVLLAGRQAFLAAFAWPPREVAIKVGYGLLNGLFTGYFMVELGLRIVEDAFGVVTDLRLAELADLNQPILKKFSIEAPGTFHHSQMVGTLAEAAAEAVGANPLLCRVGAHFHDLGKMAKPEYYIENVTAGGPTKHDGLTPRMSTLIIVSHVKDGIEMAEELGLPRSVVSCIPEHHGTIAVEYFFQQALRQQKFEGGPEPAKDDFRYPGPKPQSKETAILMIADSVEAISRVLTEPNPSRIAEMVHDVVMRRLSEGQFDDCAITLAELKRVEEAMCRVLLGIFHGRIRYPKAATVDRPSESDADAPAAGEAGAAAAPAAAPVAAEPQPVPDAEKNLEPR